MYTLPELPFAADALEPSMSRETLDYHYGKHHRAYVNKLNELVKGTDYERHSLEELIRATRPLPGQSSPVFNNAAQAWNHAFFWQCLTPAATAPDTRLNEALRARFSSLDEFRNSFSSMAANTFGSGWAWLVADEEGQLDIVSTGNAETPVGTGRKPLLTCDVWEHAYYIDYRNSRPDYLAAFWKIVNWDFVSANLSRAQVTSRAA